MPDRTPQSYANHARYDPMFHFFLIPASALILIGTLLWAYRYPGVFAYMLVFWAVVFIVALFKMRLYALRNQDRIIRLEERLRLAMLLPEHLRARIPELSTRQLIGLRFCSDTELAALTERALNERLEPKAIKQAVKEWRGDYLRI
jgi:hypothetical protein